MTQKPVLTEAVMFMADQGVAKQMLYPEFEALLDGMVSAPEFADETVEAVFLQINPRLQIRAAVFFLIDINQDGQVSKLWNMPLRQLAERAARGPDLGGGPIRLVCLGFAPTKEHRQHLWKPAQRAGKPDFVLIRDAVRSNSLGILGEDEEAARLLSSERLHLAAVESLYGDTSMPQTPGELQAEIEHLRDERQLHVQQIESLKSQLDELHEQIDGFRKQKAEEMRLIKERHSEHLHIVQGELMDVKNQLQEQQRINGTLKRDLARLQTRTTGDTD
ncbi:MAG: hypothetical protein WAV92_10115 [Halopseudomonas yangmingensis]|uniref:Chromosome segregation ATPase n=1 Tax=Halopseudomonas yangmingensis TaxID=1720063 RepID=A0A1I4Q0Q7_9GAMM|nr:hypothetical protein [Halopseudomonas yangmingensis]SFM33658.1 hypothetical protein SAMN05216217_103223 [Halopseudomonas yangmingensis]